MPVLKEILNGDPRDNKGNLQRMGLAVLIFGAAAIGGGVGLGKMSPLTGEIAAIANIFLLFGEAIRQTCISGDKMDDAVSRYGDSVIEEAARMVARFRSRNRRS